MFTGIIEATGVLESLQILQGNLLWVIRSPVSDELRVDQSVSHDGACLTVTGVDQGTHQVTAIRETLKKTNLESLRPGHWVNLERSLKLGDRLDGHLVQGHVDCRGVCKRVSEKEGSHEIQIGFPPEFSKLVIEKGSVCMSGISLTVFDVTDREFSVAIIPYTYEHTNIRQLMVNDLVNLEFDLIGKYILRQQSHYSTPAHDVLPG